MVPELIEAEITLDRAPDDPPEYDLNYQEELATFVSTLEAAGVEYSQRLISLQSADAGGWPIGNFALSCALGAIPTLAGLAGAWVQARYGRKVRIKVGDMEAEANTVEEIERLLKLTIVIRGHAEGARMSHDWKKEAFEAFEAKWAEEEAKWRGENVGKVRLYLLNASDDAPTFTADGQDVLRSVMAALKENEIKADAPFMTVDSADAVGGYTGEIAVFVQAIGPVLTGILGAWLQSKAGRKVRLRDGDIEVEAQTVDEVSKLLDMVAKRRAKQEREDQ
jgi:hypothetical protein